MNICYNISRNLAKLGHDITIITTDFEYRKDFSNDVQQDGIQVIHFKCVMNLSSFFYSPRMKRWLDENIQNFDVVHLHDFRTYQNIICNKFCSLNHIPYILQAHGDIHYSEKRFLKWLFDQFWGNKILNGARYVIALTESEIFDYLNWNVEKRKIVNIPNGLEISNFNKLPEKGTFLRENKIPLNAKIILYLGRIHERKGISYLIDAFSILLPQYPTLLLIIAGPDHGYLSSLKKQIKSLQIEDKVIFMGYITEYAKLSVYVDAEILVYPGRDEIFGLVPFEALMCGTPVIVADDSGCGELVRNGDCGVLIKYGDVSDLKDKIQYMIENPDNQKKLVQNGQKFIFENLAWAQIMKKVLTIYETCINQNKK